MHNLTRKPIDHMAFYDYLLIFIVHLIPRLILNQIMTSHCTSENIILRCVMSILFVYSMVSYTSGSEKGK